LNVLPSADPERWRTLREKDPFERVQENEYIQKHDGLGFMRSTQPGASDSVARSKGGLIAKIISTIPGGTKAKVQLTEAYVWSHQNEEGVYVITGI